jgi:hypothetical protein
LYCGRTRPLLENLKHRNWREMFCDNIGGTKFVLRRVWILTLSKFCQSQNNLGISCAPLNQADYLPVASPTGLIDTSSTIPRRIRLVYKSNIRSILHASQMWPVTPHLKDPKDKEYNTSDTIPSMISHLLYYFNQFEPACDLWLRDTKFRFRTSVGASVTLFFFRKSVANSCPHICLICFLGATRYT